MAAKQERESSRASVRQQWRQTRPQWPWWALGTVDYTSQKIFWASTKCWNTKLKVSLKAFLILQFTVIPFLSARFTTASKVHYFFLCGHFSWIIVGAFRRIEDALGTCCDALGTHWGCIGDALGTHWRRIGVAFGTHWGRIGDALETHWGRIRDAFGTHSGRIRDAFGTYWECTRDELGEDWGRIGDALETHWKNWKIEKLRDWMNWVKEIIERAKRAERVNVLRALIDWKFQSCFYM